jgi:hypothetical protein
MWELDIPQIAWSSEAVLTALLGISALNLFSLNPQDTELAYASKVYYERALNLQRIGVSHLEKQNASTLTVAAILIVHHSWL